MQRKRLTWNGNLKLVKNWTGFDLLFRCKWGGWSPSWTGIATRWRSREREVFKAKQIRHLSIRSSFRHIMKPATFEEVCSMDFRPRNPGPGLRTSNEWAAKTNGYASLQSLKTTQQQTHSIQSGTRDVHDLRSSRNALKSSRRARTLRYVPDGEGSDGLHITVQGANPRLRESAMSLRDAVTDSDVTRLKDFKVLDQVLDDSISALQSIEAKYSKALEQKRLARMSKCNLDIERSQVSEVARLSEEVQSLRAESRHLSILEGELKLARSARPWLNQLSSGIFACEHCIVRVKSVALCRIVYGHTLGVIGEDANLVTELHSSYLDSSRSGGIEDKKPVIAKLHSAVQNVRCIRLSPMLLHSVDQEFGVVCADDISSKYDTETLGSG